ncbi:MAG: M67 family metallopeptidase [Deltaproteobacteria bacterium]|jgi:proteasome lid subunit RPN8/RPN11|nr:M67 family metallopeptidase [Deltaproteobacteria bacterium]
MIELKNQVAFQIRAEAEKTYPYECCGFVFGLAQEDKREISAVLPSRNSREQTRRSRRYSIEPEDFLAAEVEASRLGLELLGIFHSHPDHPAEPSEYDLKTALPFYSYLIVSVENAAAKNLTSWLLTSDRRSFLQEKVIEE